MTKDLHFKEDTAKPENRVNICLFHLMMVEDIRKYVFDKLTIAKDSVIYPSPNLTTEEFDINCRPDFAINLENKLSGYIEVELGWEDSKQLKRYRSEQHLPVYSIIGKRSYGECDLSLEELYHHIKSIQPKYKGTQIYQSINLLMKLLDYYVIQGNVYNRKPISLSDNMKDSILIRYFYKYFGSDRIIENGNVQRGKIMFNTRGENGFSLRVFSTETNSGGLSLMNRTGGRATIYFPSTCKLNKYLPDQKKAIENYCVLIAELGAKEIFRIEGNKRCCLPLDIVENNADRFCKLIENIIAI